MILCANMAEITFTNNYLHFKERCTYHDESSFKTIIKQSNATWYDLNKYIFHNNLPRYIIFLLFSPVLLIL